MTISMTAINLDDRKGNSYHANKSNSNVPVHATRPRFEDLPLQPGHPKGSAWGLWGDEDERGTLNLLTEDVVLAASSEVSLGRVVSLKYVVAQI